MAVVEATDLLAAYADTLTRHLGAIRTARLTHENSGAGGSDA